MHAPKKLMTTARALGSTGCVTGGHNKVVRVAEGRVEEQGTPAQVFGAPTSPRLTQLLSTWRDRRALFGCATATQRQSERHVIPIFS